MQQNGRGSRGGEYWCSILGINSAAAKVYQDMGAPPLPHSFQSNDTATSLSLSVVIYKGKSFLSIFKKRVSQAWQGFSPFPSPTAFSWPSPRGCVVLDAPRGVHLDAHRSPVSLLNDLPPALLLLLLLLLFAILLLATLVVSVVVFLFIIVEDSLMPKLAPPLLRLRERRAIVDLDGCRCGTIGFGFAVMSTLAFPTDTARTI